MRPGPVAILILAALVAAIALGASLQHYRPAEPVTISTYR